MAADQTSKFCSVCNKQTLWARRGTNHILHLLITVLLCGLWLPVWLMASIRIGGWRCQTCGYKGSLASRFAVPAVCLAIFLVMLSVVASNSDFGTTTSQPTSASAPPADATHEVPSSETTATGSLAPSRNSDANDALIPYEVIHRDETPPYKVSYDIRVNLVNERLPAKEELERVSEHLRSQEKGCERMFVLYYLPGMTVDSGAYATAHHTPQFEGVRILAMFIPKEYQHFIDPRASEQSPTHCDSLSELAKLYPGDLKDFKVISEVDPQHFEITCSTFNRDPPNIVDFEIRRSLALAVGATFAHTDFDAVKITVVPNELDPSSKQFTPQRKKSTTLSISRDAALEAYQAHVGVDSYSDLFGGMMEETYFPDSLSPEFTEVLLDESKVQSLCDELATRAKDDEGRRAEEAKWRTWKDATGKHAIEASYSGMAFREVILTKRDGKRIKVPVDKLSKEDQEWLEANGNK